MTPCDIDEICATTKGSASTDYDRIIYVQSDLLLVYDSIKDPLVHLVNIVLTTGNFPVEVKIAKIVPLHKKGVHDDMNNCY